MEFQYPTTSLFTATGVEVVAFSVEQFHAMKNAGHLEVRPKLVKPVVEMAPKPVKPKPVKLTRGEAVIPSTPEPTEPEAA